MTKDDRSLGMDRAITRRDFLNGVAVAALSTAIPQAVWGSDSPEESYPPRRTGLRGSHPGAFENAHKLRDQGDWNLNDSVDTGEDYDLVIVGGGISGLSAAHLFKKRVGAQAKVLVLDNHDDFGGHAKRNEFLYQGKLLALNGGTLNIESPLRYNAPAKEVLADIGIDLDRYVAANAQNRQLYKSLGLGSGLFFDRESWKTDRLVKQGPTAYDKAFLDQSLFTPAARRDLERLLSPDQPDYLPGLDDAEKKLLLAKMSYQDYLLKVAKVDPSLLWLFGPMPRGWYCAGADAIPALFTWNDGLPGFAGLKLQAPANGTLELLPGGQHGRQRMAGGGGEIHFPDGNATIARLLVRSLIPAVVPGNTMEDVGAAHLRYDLLDQASEAVRIRLSSTVVRVEQDAEPARARHVDIAYVKDGKTYRVRGKACIMACWNMVIPYVVPSLPAAQKEALAFNVKRPLVYTSVALRNWHSFQKLGLQRISTPGLYFAEIALSEAASLGDLHHPQNPDEPIVAFLERTPCEPGLPIKDQHRAGRAELLGTSFETFERNIREQMNRVLGAGGFDAARDIVAITVNRWPHGYAYSYNSLYDPLEWVFSESSERPNVIARAPFGLISIANSDAAASPHTDAAILEGHRAVIEVIDRRAMPLRG